MGRDPFGSGVGHPSSPSTTTSSFALAAAFLCALQCAAASSYHDFYPEPATRFEGTYPGPPPSPVYLQHSAAAAGLKQPWVGERRPPRYSDFYVEVEVEGGYPQPPQVPLYLADKVLGVQRKIIAEERAKQQAAAFEKEEAEMNARYAVPPPGQHPRPPPRPLHVPGVAAGPGAPHPFEAGGTDNQRRRYETGYVPPPPPPPPPSFIRRGGPRASSDGAPPPPPPLPLQHPSRPAAPFPGASGVPLESPLGRLDLAKEAQVALEKAGGMEKLTSDMQAGVKEKIREEVNKVLKEKIAAQVESVLASSKSKKE